MMLPVFRAQEGSDTPGAIAAQSETQMIQTVPVFNIDLKIDLPLKYPIQTIAV